MMRFEPWRLLGFGFGRGARAGLLAGWLCFGTVTGALADSSRSPAEQPPAKALADELPRIPPTEPAKALSTITVQAGFHLELFAAEPLVASPVDACFDEDGRMYVAEMRDYPFSWEPTTLNPRGGGKKDAGVVRLLEDTDENGKANKSIVFADKLTWPTSVCCYKGGIFCLAPPHLWYLKDTDGDGVADVRQIVLSGFRRDNVQAVANNLKWSLENRIVFAGGRNGGDLRRDGKTVFSIRGRDISLDPSTLDVSPLTGGEQFGLSFDDWGNRFVCNNSNHIEQVLFEDRYLRRNPYYAVPAVIRTIAKEGAAAPVFRRSPPEPWRVVRTRRRVSDPAVLRSLPRTEQFAVGYFTSAAGVTIYRGDAYPPTFRGNVFIGDVGGNLVHRKLLARDGALLSARRADDQIEFIASTDNWFRPVNFVNGPDGTLYLLDMYRETIEHPASIPDDIKAHLDLESGEDRGRIYRLGAPGSRRRPRVRLGRQSSRDLIGRLESDNAWERETAQRLLWERQDKSAVAPLLQMAAFSKSPLGRLHALYTLGGLGGLSDDVLLRGLADAEPRLRAHALRLCESRLRQSRLLLAAVTRLADDRDPLVRFQLALSLGEAPAAESVEPLARLARTARNDELLSAAILTSVGGNAALVAGRLLADEAFISQPGSDALLGELASVVAAQPDQGKVSGLLREVFVAPARPALQLRMLRGLGEGLSRRGDTLSALIERASLERPAPSLVGDLKRSAARLFEKAAAVAVDPSREDSERASGIGLLAFAPSPRASEVLEGLLTPESSPALQSAAIAALANHDGPNVARQLLAGWRSFGPAARRDVIDGLLKSPARLEVLFRAIESGELARGEIERDIKQILLNHPRALIRNRARKVFDADRSTNRTAIIAQYTAALAERGRAEQGRVDQGRAVYEKRCSICHRYGKSGSTVGPDLASVQNKSPADLLVAILDPSREAQPNYVAYTLVTRQGAVYSGIIAAETAAAVTLRRAEGKEDRIGRSQIEQLLSTGKSLMPEGLEKDIPPDQMADLIAFIKSLPSGAAAR